jgi:hypothetical protein
METLFLEFVRVAPADIMRIITFRYDWTSTL